MDQCTCPYNPIKLVKFLSWISGLQWYGEGKCTMSKIFHIDLNTGQLSAAGLVSAQLSANDTRRVTLAPQRHVYLQHICGIFQVRISRPYSFLPSSRTYRQTWFQLYVDKKWVPCPVVSKMFICGHFFRISSCRRVPVGNFCVDILSVSTHHL